MTLLVLLADLGADPALAGREPVIKADRILVLKSEPKLLLLHYGAVLRSYPIALGSRPTGPKRTNGDGKTPEGVYVIDGRHARSPYPLALHISYPNAADRVQATAAHANPGGDIFIHGLPAWYGPNDPDRFYKDWTKGCISVGSKAIEEIGAAVADGTPIEIRPRRRYCDANDRPPWQTESFALTAILQLAPSEASACATQLVLS
jgi:murein L,D-transpeptidase YafK